MYSLLKAWRRFAPPLLVPAVLLFAALLAGCSAAQPDTAGGVSPPPAASGAAQSPRPEGTAMPSATADSMAAGAEAAPVAAPPSAVPVTGQAPVTSAPGLSAAPAPASSSPSAAPKPAATTKPAAPKPAATIKPAAPEPAANAVTLSITGDKEHGVILAAAAYEIGENESVLELLKRITRKQKIQLEYQGSKSFAYVEGIDNLYEYDYGAESGWMYKVNGEFPSKAAGSWILNPGDTIEWLYTLDLGKDLGAAAP
ncbi:DUF4430 domain-containing protein [Paenibacillus sp. MMS20-IR301]|uniref:DUF4430 domain-containing protein n=1 Tax=Paenibacillus sp. MMS20-IR301 TaxID=2895946 RepID=UPI0028EABCE5|nr:DUF4430 domain-containing protein [Paenibacillus sp. MMS20-IR301]WNS41330.1 DUF4430 domain-containing protein [Paenibacillus sp. MMS20-IR301]